MNALMIIGFVLGGGIIGFDHLIRPIPHRLAVVLYTAAVALILIGMIISKSEGA